MSSQHLSDEAVAACADGVLRGHAAGRASRHIAECAECRTAVREQREAVFALRAAPTPSLPAGLADRLRAVPMTTPLTTLPTVLAPDGSTMLATFAGPVAALVPTASRTAATDPTATPTTTDRPKRSTLPFVAGAAVAALTGVLVAGSVAGDAAAPTRTGIGSTVQDTSGAAGAGQRGAVVPVNVFRATRP